jgi:hypothetical protein
LVRGFFAAVVVAATLSLAGAPPAGAAPVVSSFTASVNGNVITLTWQTSGGDCTPSGCSYIGGLGRYNLTGFPIGDVGYQPASGTVSFRVPNPGVFKYYVSESSGGTTTVKNASVDIATPKLPTPGANPVNIDLLKARVAAPTDTLGQITWSQPGAGYVQIQRPGQAAFDTQQYPATGSYPITGATLDGLRGTGWGPYSHAYNLRYCELLAPTATVTMGSNTLPLCTGSAPVTVRDAPDRLDAYRTLVPPGQGTTLNWKGTSGYFWIVDIPALQIHRTVTTASLALAASELPDGVHNGWLTTCRWITKPTDSDCANRYEVKATAAGKVMSLVTIPASGFAQIDPGATVATIDTNGDDTADLSLVATYKGYASAATLPVSVGQTVVAGQDVVTYTSGIDGWFMENVDKFQIVVGSQAATGGPQATWTSRSWSVDFTSGSADWSQMWKHPMVGSPLDVTVSNTGTAWTIGEYNQSIGQHGAGGVDSQEIPLARYWNPNWGGGTFMKVSPFGSNFPPYNTTSPISGWGESIITDEQGVVWATQGGSPYNVNTANHSRIVRFDPRIADSTSTSWNDAFCMVNVPGDKNAALGLARDVARDRIWFSEYQAGPGTSLSWFKPGDLPCDNFLDYNDPTALANAVHKYCSDTVTTGCITKMDLPGFVGIGHIQVDDAGVLWFTDYQGSALGRYDPSDPGAGVKRYPTATPLQSSYFGAAPWQLRVMGGYVYFVEYDTDIVRFDTSRWNDAQCTQPWAEQTTKCLQELHLPKRDDGDSLHSIVVSGNTLWFTITSTPFSKSDAVAPSFGSIDLAAWNAGQPTGVLYTGAKSLAPGTRIPSGSPAYCGIAIDPTNGNLVIADYLRRQLIRLHPRV